MSSGWKHLGDATSRVGLMAVRELFSRMRAEVPASSADSMEALSGTHHAFLNQELLRIFDASGLFVEIANLDCEFLYVNQSFTERFGYTLADLKGQRLTDLRPHNTTLSSCADVADVVIQQGRIWEGDYDRITAQGQRVQFFVRIAPLRNAQGVVDAIMIIGAESTPQVDDYVQLERYAFQDALTGLPNRLLFEDRLQHRISRMNRQPEVLGALLFLDVDAFKLINDQHGHEAGDRLLVELGRRLQSCLRPSDTVCRYGGDEFAILLDNITEKKVAIAIAQELTQAIAQPFTLSPGVDILPSASIGITHITPPEQRVEDLMREADAAMYQAKALQAAFVVFDQSLDEETQRARLIQRSLAKSVQLNDFELYLRPVVDCRTGEIAELNLTAMWQHEDNPPIPADRWLETADASESVSEVLCWLLRAAANFDQALTDQPLTYRYPLQIPVTPRGICAPAVRELIREISEERPLLSFVFIVNDSQSKLTTAAVDDALTYIRSLGHRVVLDHFGRATISMATLTSLPLDGVRITPSLAEAAHSDRRTGALVRAMYSFAIESGYTIAAAGVDTQENFTWFKRNRWSSVQGDAVGPYMPAARMLDWLTLQPDRESVESPLYS